MASRAGGLSGTSPALPSFQVAEMRRTLTPANSPVSSPSKHGDRFIPSRAGANWSVNFHRINVRAAQRAGPGGGGPGGRLQLTPPRRPQENEKSPSQNRKAKDATSDNGKGQGSHPVWPPAPLPPPPRPLPQASPSPPPTDGLAYSALLKNELLGAGIEKVQDPQTEDRRLQPSTPEKKGLFTVSTLSLLAACGTGPPQAARLGRPRSACAHPGSRWAPCLEPGLCSAAAPQAALGQAPGARS